MHAYYFTPEQFDNIRQVVQETVAVFTDPTEFSGGFVKGAEHVSDVILDNLHLLHHFGPEAQPVIGPAPRSLADV